MKHSALLSLALLLSACGASHSDSEGVRIFPAQTVVTVDAANPTAEAVAIRDDIIIGVDSLANLERQFPKAQIDEKYGSAVIIPGLIDPHVHMTLGAMMYGLDWVPPWDMQHPNGVIEGLGNKTKLLQSIKSFSLQNSGDNPLILYGYHNLVQGDITKTDLDAISNTRPIILWHYSGHDFYMNSKALELFEITSDLHKTYEGVAVDAAGNLTGRIYEDAVAPLLPKLGPYLLNPKHIQKGFNGFESILTRGGVTTAAEMGYGIFGREFENQVLDAHYNHEAPYTLYLVPEHRAFQPVSYTHLTLPTKA